MFCPVIDDPVNILNILNIFWPPQKYVEYVQKGERGAKAVAANAESTKGEHALVYTPMGRAAVAHPIEYTYLGLTACVLTARPRGRRA